MYLRRVHEKQVTASDGTGQKIGHILTRYGNNLLCSRRQRITMTPPGRMPSTRPACRTLNCTITSQEVVPDKLVRRDVRIVRDVTRRAESPRTCRTRWRIRP